MTEELFSDTIGAICTAAGEGAISIVRLSGPDSLRIAGKIFRAKGAVSLGRAESHKMLYGHIYEGGRIIDEVFCVYMRSPRSYTAEDGVEIHCHGGRMAARKILALAGGGGARMAAPGEFTQRAFLNGRIDLSQAEAVMAIVRSSSDLALRQAVCQQEGRLSGEIKKMRAQLKAMLAEAQAALDYPEEDLEAPAMEKLAVFLQELSEQIAALLKTAHIGRAIREGLRTVIAGKPNVGKSSLLNRLSGYDAAIVDEMAGTTRDSIEEQIFFADLPLLVADTAGVRDTADKVERLGIEKSLAKIRRADLRLFVLDGSEPLDKDDWFLLENFRDKPYIVLVNKSDLPSKIECRQLKQRIGCADGDIVNISLKDKTGWTAFQSRLKQKVYGGGAVLAEGIYVQEARHIELLEKAAAATRDALNAAKSGLPLDCALIDCENAFYNLGLITGEAVSDEILREIFSRFCLGK
jgi:tRNA modification GTPase